MTVVVAYFCTDGVVVATDSMITPSMGNISVGHHHGQKIDILSGPQVFAFAGDQGLAGRARTMANALYEKIRQEDNPLSFPIALTVSVIQEFKLTSANPSAINAVLAFPFGNQHQCCVFEGPFQPRLLDINHFYVALGTGKLSADPFLRFLCDIFCEAGPPSVREAIFLSTWVVQHVIDTNPGGVAGPIKIAVLEGNAQGNFTARELPDNEIAEHKQAVDSALGALKTWREDIQSGEAASDAPPQPSVPVAKSTSVTPALPRSKNQRA